MRTGIVRSTRHARLFHLDRDRGIGYPGDNVDGRDIWPRQWGAPLSSLGRYSAIGRVLQRSSR
jgi:hypothetical protein